MKADDAKKSKQGGQEVGAGKISITRMHREEARAKFRHLILANPNYFGNLKESPFPPVLDISSDTSFEEIACVGFQPQMNLLEAVVHIKRDSGYGGDVCSSGTPEYVRFYLSFDDGATWLDQGMGSFTAYDTPGDKPLEYDVTVPIDIDKVFCFVESLPRVRAILSWNNPPPPNTPNFPPVWGKVVEARIQIDATQFFLLDKLFQQAAVKVPPSIEQAVDLSQPVAAAKPKELGLGELQALYKNKDVPAHRFLFTAVQKLVAEPALTASVMTPGFKGVLADLADIDLGAVIGNLLNTDGDTTFEQLDCVGLSPSGAGLPDALVGILTVKLPNGFSGDLCSAGSQENVAFWVDYGAGLTYAGTASVVVHDIKSIPPEGLKYAVFLPVDLTCRRQPCGNGPRTAKVRAVLAWEQLPPPGNPDFQPTWGNRQETLILINPGPVCQPDDHTPFIDTVGNMAVCDINQTTGMATGTGVIAAFTARESPFGRTITITGFILNAPNVMAGDVPFKYKLYVRENGGPWEPLSNSFPIKITEGNPVVQYADTQSVDGGGFYTYREQMFTNQWRLVAGRVLGSWRTDKPMTGIWEIKLEALLPGMIIVPAGVIHCPDGSTRSSVKVYLDEYAPVPHIQITGFERGGGPVKPAVNCGSFQKGDIIHGTYSVTDAHFNALTLHVEPVVPAGGAVVVPSIRSYPVVPTTGEAGNWKLDTAPMAACGYIIRLEASDRTIVDSGFIGFSSSDSTGFCLVLP